MKKILLISLLLFSKIAFSQVSDHFNDGDFSQNPVWMGDVNYFQINASKQLQSSGQNLARQTISLSTTNTYVKNASWEFLVRLNFNPTTSNFVRIYLVSNNKDLEAALNGYFVQIGETGNTDGFHLYCQSGTTISKIITGAPKTRANTNLLMAKVKVTRDESGKWSLYTDVTGGNNFNLEGSVTDNNFTTSSFMGVYCKYATASRFNQYIFDDFEVNDLTPDVIPPTLKSVAVLDPTHLEVTFSEALDQSSALLSTNYNLSGFGNPINVTPGTLPNVYRLTFLKELSSGDYSLSVNNVKDLKANIISQNSILNFTYIKAYLTKYGDLVINEIFANPTGSPALPQKEFVELWNTTDEYILTQGWKYADQSSSYSFLIDTIKPKEYIILCAKADENLFRNFGKVIGLSSWPSLNNDKDILTLTNPIGTVIDKVTYSDSWYKDEAKKKGGFSLELIDPKNICGGSQNWMASNDLSGGTPGKQNNVYHDQISSTLPKLLSSTVRDSLSIELEFSKSVDSLSASQPLNYFINNGIGNPASVIMQPPFFKVALLKFTNALQRGVESVLTVKNVIDCAGNLIDQNANSAKLFLVKKIEKNDILISEVLFNPKLNGVDFVEVYNNSDHLLDLMELQIANADVNGKPASVKNVSAKKMLLLPKSYWVISSNILNVKTNYFAENLLNFSELVSMPAFNNDKGSVILISNNQVIDQFNYNEKMHIPLLQNVDGVSLERVSFLKATNEKGNFKSAAASVGFATPTYKNSQELNGEERYVKLVSKTFSPDGDGFQDLLQLDYQFTENASFATVNIFTDKGILVKKLMKNETIGTKGSLIWDGLDDRGQLGKIGIYVIIFDVFDLNGSTKRFKNTCVLAGKFD
jgi:hypothetical protein